MVHQSLLEARSISSLSNDRLGAAPMLRGPSLSGCRASALAPVGALSIQVAATKRPRRLMRLGLTASRHDASGYCYALRFCPDSFLPVNAALELSTGGRDRPQTPPATARRSGARLRTARCRARPVACAARRSADH